MKIKWIEYKNAFTKMEIKRLFFNDLTLLVGLSGVGKTNILKAINLFVNINKGIYSKEMLDVTLRINFEIDNSEYEWYIVFGEEALPEEGYKDEENSNSSKSAARNSLSIHVLEEYLLVNGKPHIERDGEAIRYKGETVRGLSQTLSGINIFGNDEEVKKIFSAFTKMNFYLAHHLLPAYNFSVVTVNRFKNLTDSEDSINSALQGACPPIEKLCILHEKRKSAFKQVEQAYCDIFKQVEKLFFSLDEDTNSYFLFQEEKDVSVPIVYSDLSSGMRKTLMLLTDLYACNDGNVFLIDEFENSFGANCINDITDIVNSKTDKFQFIIASHHPYIINNISTDCWSVVERKGSVITARSAKEFGIGSTKHDAFFELINIWHYEEASL